jgi:hypothetical protein
MAEGPPIAARFVAARALAARMPVRPSSIAIDTKMKLSVSADGDPVADHPAAELGAEDVLGQVITRHG